jgi:hypothetical protein
MSYVQVILIVAAVVSLVIQQLATATVLVVITLFNAWSGCASVWGNCA